MQLAADAAVKIRTAVDADAEQLIRLIGDVFAEYPNCILDVQAEEPELLAIASAYANKGGQFWVAEVGERVVGSVGWAPLGAESPSSGIELKKLYVERSYRRRGIGRRLAELVEAAGGERGATQVELWSDSRFVEAHSFYMALGYARTGRARELLDLSDTVEYEFHKRLSQVPH